MNADADSLATVIGSCAALVGSVAGAISVMKRTGRPPGMSGDPADTPADPVTSIQLPEGRSVDIAGLPATLASSIEALAATVSAQQRRLAEQADRIRLLEERDDARERDLEIGLAHLSTVQAWIDAGSPPPPPQMPPALAAIIAARRGH